MFTLIAIVPNATIGDVLEAIKKSEGDVQKCELLIPPAAMIPAKKPGVARKPKAAAGKVSAVTFVTALVAQMRLPHEDCKFTRASMINQGVAENFATSGIQSALNKLVDKGQIERDPAVHGGYIIRAGVSTNEPAHQG